MEGFKVKFQKLCRGSEWECNRQEYAIVCVCVRERERKRDLGSAGTTEKEERGRWHCWCYMQPTRK